jgi:NitT/TauT family transport system substrate-binding protein
MRYGRMLLSGLSIALALGLASPEARSEATELRISKGYGIHYLPLYVMEHEKLVEKHAKVLGLGDIKVTSPIFDGGNVINDAMLSGALDIAPIGVPGFLTLWDKTKGNARLEIAGIAAVGAGAVYLNSRDPEVKTLADFKAKDKIALPGIKTSTNAVILEMAAAHEFGDANYAKLDPLTVGMPYPEAFAALVSGKTEITAHLASPPFSLLELDHPGIHRVFSSGDLLGNLTMIMSYTTKQFHDKNPKLTQAFVDALQEATEFITHDPHAAAQIYIELAKVKMTEPEALRIVTDPNTHFTATPEGIMKYADFMHRVGTIKKQPEDWKELFFPEVHDRQGS